jgi:phage gp36-like protein
VAYCIKADILERLDSAILISLTDDSGAGVEDDDVITRAIADADAEIDGYVGSRHSVPLSPVPAVIRKYSVDISIWNIYTRRTEATPEVKDRYDSAMKFLDRVSKGQISLGADDPEGSPPDSGKIEVSDDNPERIFNRDKMKGF